jgi:hypothetical protein
MIIGEEYADFLFHNHGVFAAILRHVLRRMQCFVNDARHCARILPAVSAPPNRHSVLAQSTLSHSRMKTAYRIDPPAHMVRVDYEGHPTFQEWSAMMEAIFADLAFTPGFDFLFDKRTADSAPDTDYVHAAARFYRRHRDKMGRWAIVVKGLLPYGMSRMTAAICDPNDNVRVFTDLAEAQEWLQHALK